LDRGDAYDPPAPILDHVRRDELRAHVYRFEIDLDRPAPVFQAVFQDRPGCRINRRVVDQGIDLAELVEALTGTADNANPIG
jgi:hypothetical protein